MERRRFIENLSGLLLAISLKKAYKKKTIVKSNVVVATWNHKTAVEKASNLMNRNSVLDAIEKGINHVELDPNDQSVGYGGRPDASGVVTLDACIMNDSFEAGSVSYLKNIKTPISVARKVMSETPHVMLVGTGAYEFAISQGFNREDLLTEKSKKEYEKWKIKEKYKPIINIENHDTIGMIAMNSQGNLAGGCSTSGLAYKKPGRVGDSPIIGAGLYVDPEAGAATATGLGEKMLTTMASFMVVEWMRQGHSSTEACKLMVERIYRINHKADDYQVGFIAIDKQGEVGAYALHKGFVFTFAVDNTIEVKQSDFLLK